MSGPLLDHVVNLSLQYRLGPTESHVTSPPVVVSEKSATLVHVLASADHSTSKVGTGAPAPALLATTDTIIFVASNLPVREFCASNLRKVLPEFEPSISQAFTVVLPSLILLPSKLFTLAWNQSADGKCLPKYPIGSLTSNKPVGCLPTPSLLPIKL